MTQPGYRHRIIVMDRSGSIRSILAGQQSGLEEFLKSERGLPGKLTVSLWDFDEEIRCMYSFATADDALTYRIEPRGMTAMYDAIGDAVEEEGRRLSLMAEGERPEDVTVVIASDGLENASARRDGGAVKEMLDRQQKAYGWRVIYMGTNQDAIREGAKMGVTMDMAVNYSASSTGSQNSWASSASLLRRAPVAMASPAGYAFNEEERALAESEEPQAPSELKAGPKRKLP